VDIHAYSQREGEAVLSGFVRRVPTSEKSASLEETIMMSPFALECRLKVWLANPMDEDD